ncbi:hypothetical protein VAT7223_02083 [Vibrio atlanticus]|uniref:Uncharacterized protein n=1 Tax=Vibrio atlanticus TaxID=693153 RepID=A0A1C3ISD8_9VIBR|nr:hypothetical protein VAT7223_02083 [Vibrio atlanticus]
MAKALLCKVDIMDSHQLDECVCFELRFETENNG